MFCSRGLFSPEPQQRPTRPPAALEAKILVEVTPPTETKENELQTHYDSLDHYDELLELRKLLASSIKNKGSGAPTPIRSVNWLLSFTGIPVNQGDVTDAFNVVNEAFKKFNPCKKDVFVTEVIPETLKKLLSIYQSIATNGDATKAIDKTFKAFLRVKAADLNAEKLDKLLASITSQSTPAPSMPS